jgi:hypothetical protein
MFFLPVILLKGVSKECYNIEGDFKKQAIAI